MAQIILSPPVAFLIMLFTVMAIAGLLSRLSFKVKTHAAGELKSYACGEEMEDQKTQPDYGQFFPFAFFFTILHVVALVIATIPSITKGTIILAFIFIAGSVVGLSILFRK